MGELGTIIGIALVVSFLYEICYPYSGLRIDSLKKEVEKEVKKLDKVLSKLEKYKKPEVNKKSNDEVSQIFEKAELTKKEFNEIVFDKISDAKVKKNTLDDYHSKFKVLNLEADNTLRKKKIS